MKRLILTACLGTAVLAASARADVMHWFWEVEVNGQARDASRPIMVADGDQVDIELWGDFEPYRSGFAYADYAIATGDEFFRVAAGVNISRRDGYGRNTYLDFDPDGAGEFSDSDADGVPDIIDEIGEWQAPPAFNAEFDPSDPIFLYRIGWTLAATPAEGIALSRTGQLDGDSVTWIFADDWGGMAEYANVIDTVRFIPAPSSALILGVLAVAQPRRRRCTTASGTTPDLDGDRDEDGTDLNIFMNEWGAGCP